MNHLQQYDIIIDVSQATDKGNNSKEALSPSQSAGEMTREGRHVASVGQIVTSIGKGVFRV